MPRLRDDGRLRDLKAPVAPLFLTGVLVVCAVSHHSRPDSLDLQRLLIKRRGCGEYYGVKPAYLKAVGAGRQVLVDLPA